MIENKKIERDLLIKRLMYLLYIAFKKENWKRVEEYSSLLIKLRGNDHDYWMHVLSLEQQGKFEELQKSMQDFDSIFSMKPSISSGVINGDVGNNWIKISHSILLILR